MPSATGTVRTSTAVRPGGDAGVVRIRGTRRAVAATTDCNGRYVYLEPGTGARIAVAEAARNLVCVGAVPTAVTNNLNFGNPLKPHIYYQLREAVLGLAEACEVFETPVTGGNVSLFNETDGRAIYPTPVIGMVGVIDEVSHITPQAFVSAGAIVCAGVVPLLKKLAPEVMSTALELSLPVKVDIKVGENWGQME